MTISSQCSITSVFVIVGMAARSAPVTASTSTPARRFACHGDRAFAVRSNARQALIAKAVKPLQRPRETLGLDRKPVSERPQVPLTVRVELARRLPRAVPCVHGPLGTPISRSIARSSPPIQRPTSSGIDVTASHASLAAWPTERPPWRAWSVSIGTMLPLIVW